MIIDLPKNLRGKDNSYVVCEHTIYLRNQSDFFKNVKTFHAAMIEITYLMKGRRKCHYCGKTLSKSEASIDHLYSRRIGGPTITNNLIVSCQGCNCSKSDLTEEQFDSLKKIRDLDEKLAYLTRINAKREMAQKDGLFLLPNTWIEEIQVSNICIPHYKISKENYEKKREVFLRYHHFVKPIVVDRNLKLLEGLYEVLIARDFNIPVISAIRLDNVEVVSKTYLEEIMNE